MATLLKAYRPDGSVRGVWRDETAAGFRAAGVMPARASRVEVVPEGPHRSDFHVDFSPLADATGDDRFRVCLAATFASYTAAVAAEVRWLEEHWVLGGTRGTEER